MFKQTKQISFFLCVFYTMYKHALHCLVFQNFALPENLWMALFFLVPLPSIMLMVCFFEVGGQHCHPLCWWLCFFGEPWKFDMWFPFLRHAWLHLCFLLCSFSFFVHKSPPFSGYQVISCDIRGVQGCSGVIRGHHGSSWVIMGHQGSSGDIRWHHVMSCDFWSPIIFLL